MGWLRGHDEPAPAGDSAAGASASTAWHAKVRSAADLMERGDPEAAIQRFYETLSDEMTDLDRSLICRNIGVVYGSVASVDDALTWYDHAASYEASYEGKGRGTQALECKAAYLHGLGRSHEALALYRQLLDQHRTDADADTADADATARLRHNISVLGG